MIRNLLATTAVVAVITGGAHAAETDGTAEAQASDRFLTAASDASLASKIIGESVYTGTAENAEAVGEVNDLLVGSDGEIDAAIIGVGGFLGVGEKNVAINYDELELTTDEDGNYHIVLNTSREELEAAPSFDVGALEQPDAASRDDMASEPRPADERATAADRDAAAPEDRMAAESPPPAGDPMATDRTPPAGDMAVPSGQQDYALVDPGTMGTDQLLGANVYSYDNENIGDVSEVVLTDDGRIEAIIVDVGGFLGIGAKSVAVAFEDLDFRADEGQTIYVYTGFTREQLESAAEYDQDQYEENRDHMLLRSSG
jgi:sporulation protein YlmC with PRC-barrel domain